MTSFSFMKSKRIRAKNLLNLWPGLFIAMNLGKAFTWFGSLDFSSPFPIVNHDFFLYYARALRAHAFFERSGRYWGYDPFEMAGYIAGPVHEAGSHFMSLFSHLLAPLLSIKSSQLWLVIGGYTLAPFALLVAARFWDAGWKQAWSAFAVAVLMYGTIDSLSSNLVPRGIFGFQMACFLALIQVGAFRKFALTGGWGMWAALTVASAVLLQLHPGVVFVTILPLLLLYIVSFRLMTLRQHVLVAVAVGITWASNAYWVRPYLAFRHWQVPVGNFPTGGWPDVINEFNPFRLVFDVSVRALAKFFIFAAAVIAVRLRFLDDRREGWIWTAWLFALFIIGFFGSEFSFLRELQPARYRLALWLVMDMMAGFSIPLLLKDKESVFTAVSAACLFCVFFLTTNPAPPFSTRLPSDQAEVVGYLQANGRPPGRLLLECDEGESPILNEMIPSLTGRALIGGGNPGNPLITRFTLFMGSYYDQSTVVTDKPIAFGKNFADMTETQFMSYLDLYNVTSIGAQSVRSVEKLNSFSKILIATATAGNFHFYTVKRDANWWHEGNGVLSFDYDALTVDHPSAGPLVLKFHWIRTLNVEPPVPMKPVMLMDDPVPFIGIDNTAKADRIVIRNSGLDGRI